MAIYTLPAGVARINRSRGGATFSQCGNTFAIRTRRKPRLKRTPRASQVRGTFQTTQSRWKTLSAHTQANYAYATSLWPRTNSLGATYYVSPINIWAQKQVVLLNLGHTPSTNAPSPTTPPSVMFQFASIITIPFIITYEVDPSTIPGNYFYRFWATPPINLNAKPSFPHDFKVIYDTHSPDSSPFDLTPQYLDTFGVIPPIPSSSTPPYAIGLAWQAIKDTQGEVFTEDVRAVEVQGM